MKINFRQPKYVLPIVLVPFLCLLFYAWHAGPGKPKQKAAEAAGLNSTVGEVSSAVKKKQLADKLDAYRNTFKQADGQSAVGIIPGAQTDIPSPAGSPSDSARRKLDSIRRVIAKRFRTPATGRAERALAAKLKRYCPAQAARATTPCPGRP